MFECNKCGECCKNLNQDDIYSQLHSGNGVCKYFDEINNICRIYDTRPDICNVDKAYESYFVNICTKDDYYQINHEGCKSLMAKKSNKKGLNDTVIGIAQKEITQKHGEAASQMLQALRGVRYDSKGAEIVHKGRSLEQISQYKINKGHEYSNIKQQSGFSAELVKEARDNKNSILSNEETRTRTTDGIGRTNDQRHDHVKVDENSNPIVGTESQMKFKGKFSSIEEIQKSSENIVKDMISEKWDKYSDSPMDIPSEQVDYAKKYARLEAKKLRERAEKFRENGDAEKAKMLELKAEKFEIAEKNIRDSGVSSEEALNARTNHVKFVANEVMSDSHNAGIEAAKGGFIFGCAISSAQNIYSVVCEGKELDEAILDVTVSTAKASAVAYGVGATGTAIKSIMHTSKSSITRTLGRTNAPAMMATAVLEVGKSLHKYSKGEIDEVELLEELGEKGTGMIAASYGSAVGTIILPGIGTFVGGMIGYTISSLLYKETLNVLKNVEISEKRRVILENINEKAITEMKEYQKIISQQSRQEYFRKENLFENIFQDIDNSIINNNINSFFTAVNRLGAEFNINLVFKNFEEFDDFMNDKESILIL